MATTVEFIKFVMEQLDKQNYQIRYKKMFGDYMIYVNEKPIILVCDNTVFVKILPEIEEFVEDAEKRQPYKGAKEWYILDIEDRELTNKVIEILEKITPLPKIKKKINN